MCYIMLRLEGLEPTKENIRNYQAEKLGRYGGNTLLAELMPIPKPKIERWDYEELIPQFASRKEYYETIKPWRVKYLRGLIEEHRPKIVICYGKTFWGYFQELFEGQKFSEDGRFRTAETEKTQVILTDHFSARSMNGRFDDVLFIIRVQYHR
jgi:hypothetical protein